MPTATQGAVQQAIKNLTSGTSGTFSYLDAGGEQTVVELTVTAAVLIRGVWLDLVNMTNDGTVRAYYKIDGSNYRLFSETSFTEAADPDGFWLDVNVGISADLKVTYQEGADEGAARAVPYQIIQEARG